MTKAEFIAKLEGAKELTSVVSIDLVLAGLNMIEPEVKVEKVFGVTQELVDQISDRIERCLDNNSYELVDADSVALSISYNNTIEVDEAGIDVYRTMRHIDACLSEFILEEDEDDEEGERDADLPNDLNPANDDQPEGTLTDIPVEYR